MEQKEVNKIIKKLSNKGISGILFIKGMGTVVFASDKESRLALIDAADVEKRCIDMTNEDNAFKHFEATRKKPEENKDISYMG